MLVMSTQWKIQIIQGNVKYVGKMQKLKFLCCHIYDNKSGLKRFKVMASISVWFVIDKSKNMGRKSNLY